MVGPNQDKGEGPSRQQTRKKHLKKPYDDGANPPGVQKIKSAIRQTRRLLEKDTLAADLRVETERRLKSLEVDLSLAETRKKERAYALKYHKIKFFERQKITRKIKQLKTQLASESSPEKPPLTDLENALYELRVDLNYILHYPKLERYISLFPPSVRQLRRDRDADFVPPEHDDVLAEHPQRSDDPTDGKRRAIRDSIKIRMESGELNQTPELDADGSKRSRKEWLTTMAPVTISQSKILSTDGKKGKLSGHSTRHRDDHRSKEENVGVNGDEFFEI